MPSASTGPRGPIRLYEVYWADLLPDESVAGTFSKFHFNETTWFPYLNWRAGLLPRDQYSPLLIYARTLELLLLEVAASLGLEVLTASRKLTMTALDQTAADVWHYVHSLAGELAAGSPFTGSSERILGRFQAAHARAVADGTPGSTVQVIAHSLGSVIAYHGMVRRLAPHAIHRFITVGSPLEKVRFIWAKLFPMPFNWTGEWLNFHTPPDPVSGKLTRFDGDRRIQNFRVWGIGGFGEAHIGYFRNPRVMRHVAEGLGACPSARTGRSARSWLLRRAFDVAIPLGLLLTVVAGLLLTALVFYAVIWLTGAFFEYGLRPFAPRVGQWFGHGWRVFWSWVLLPLWLLFVVKDGYAIAKARHERRWR